MFNVCLNLTAQRTAGTTKCCHILGLCWYRPLTTLTIFVIRVVLSNKLILFSNIRLKLASLLMRIKTEAMAIAKNTSQIEEKLSCTSSTSVKNFGFRHGLKLPNAWFGVYCSNFLGYLTDICFVIHSLCTGRGPLKRAEDVEISTLSDFNKNWHLSFST